MCFPQPVKPHSFYGLQTGLLVRPENKVEVSHPAFIWWYLRHDLSRALTLLAVFEGVFFRSQPAPPRYIEC
jgi:hypothetical protein